MSIKNNSIFLNSSHANSFSSDRKTGAHKFNPRTQQNQKHLNLNINEENSMNNEYSDIEGDGETGMPGITSKPFSNV
jgi:hypothetical protein